MWGRSPNAAQAGLPGALAAALAVLGVVLTMPPAAADGARPSWREIWKWRETWSGVDVARDNWLIYSGLTVAPFGHIHEPGCVSASPEAMGNMPMKAPAASKTNPKSGPSTPPRITATLSSAISTASARSPRRLSPVSLISPTTSRRSTNRTS